MSSDGFGCPLEQGLWICSCHCGLNRCWNIELVLVSLSWLAVADVRIVNTPYNFMVALALKPLHHQGLPEVIPFKFSC